MTLEHAMYIRAQQLLEGEQLTRYELELRLGISQQRVSEVLRGLGEKVRVVGYKPPAWKGRPAPIYSAHAPIESRRPIGRVSSVFDLAAAF